MFGTGEGADYRPFPWWGQLLMLPFVLVAVALAVIVGVAIICLAWPILLIGVIQAHCSDPIPVRVVS